jgi:iron complex outermembrane receptor protein
LHFLDADCLHPTQNMRIRRISGISQPIDNQFDCKAMQMQPRSRFVMSLTIATPLTAWAADPGSEPAALPSVVVTATRTDQPSFRLPVSIDRIDKAAIQDEQPMVNLSESLARVPGLVAQNRQNYAQDLQISSRGFGARSTFGVRGVRLYSDGIPATMPDGQGQVSHFDLGSAARIEVMRGPFSALYGNSSGGVIALFTENGRPGFQLEGDAAAGSYGTRRYGLKASGQQDAVNYVVSGSHFRTDGYRDHSAANRDTQNAKIRFGLDADSSLTLVGNAVRMSDVQDPLGLTRAQFSANPRGVDPSAIAFNTRKSVDQQQAGLTYERTLSSADSVNAMVYAGNRSTVQFQAIPVGAQIPRTSPGGVIDLDRTYWGTDLRWTHRGTLAGKPLQWTVGTSYDNLDEKRRGFENFVGGILGVQGALRRDESNNVFNFDQYAQAQWEPTSRWLVMAGVRNSSVHVESDDHFIIPGNGDDSGATRYHAVTPVLGTTYKLSERINLYASFGKGFETPTFNELSYRSVNGTVTGLNLGLAPSRSKNYEIGVKAKLGERAQANVAAFHIDTVNELTVLANMGGRSVFQNAGKTRRDGIEASVAGNWSNGVGALLAYSLIRAVYADPFCSGPCSPATVVASGNRIPGVPNQTLYGEVSWRHAPTGFDTALEGRYAGKVYVDDVNSDAAPGYFVANVRAGLQQKLGRWTIKEFARIDNVAGRKYAGSVIVNESNRRFFEPAPGRNYLLGISAVYAW